MKAVAKQNGSSYTVVLLAAVVLGAIGLISNQMLSMNKKSNNNTAATTAPPSSAAPQILKTKDDIEHANSSLDSEKIDQNLNPDQLNQELDSIY